MRLWFRLHQLMMLVGLATALALTGPALRALSMRIEAPFPFLPETVLGPIVLASAIGYAVSTPMTELERSARRGRPGLLVVYSIAMTVSLAALLTISFTIVEGGPNSRLTIVRNVVGLTGMAFVSAAVLDGRMAFVLPTAIGLLTVSFADPHSSGLLGAWLLGIDADASSWLAMSCLFVGGLTALVLRTPVSR